MPTGRRMAAIVALGVALTILPFLPLADGSASADTVPYELYCPRSPVGNLVLNDVQTTGTLTPSSLAIGQRFSITNYQTTLLLPNEIVSAAAALGNSVISGTLTTTVHVTGVVRPASLQSSPQSFGVPIPSPIPSSGVTISVPAGPVGPFTARRDAITASVKSPTRLTLNISGSSLTLHCRTYQNNALPTGVVRRPPNRYPITPVIARSP